MAGESFFKPDDYLERIGHSGDVKISEEGLRLLQSSQIFSIPFENFDVVMGRGVSLDPALLFNKLVNKSRGGYCFELNGLFLAALEFFGFDARPLLARVHRDGEPTGRTHQLSLVNLKGRELLSDVGFGAAHMRTPIPLEVGFSTVLGDHLIRLADGGNFGIMLQTIKNDRWQDLYSFDCAYVFPGDILNGNYYTSTHPKSLFRNNRMASLPKQDGQVSLLNDTLRIVSSGVEKVRTVPEGQAYLDVLRHHFGIELNCDYNELAPITGAGSNGSRLPWADHLST